MSGGKRTLADWIWTVVGIAGVACIAVAAYLFLENGERTPEEALKEQLTRADEMWKAGREKLEAGDAEAAVSDLEEAIRLLGDPRHPAYPLLQNDLGEAYAGTGKGAEAEVCWMLALRLNPTLAKPYLNLGRQLESKGNEGRAFQFYRAALALHPDPVPEALPAKVGELDAKLGPGREGELAEIRKSLKANPAAIDAFSALLLWKLVGTKVEEDAPPAEALRAAIAGVGEELPDLAELRARQEAAAKDRPDSVVDRAGLGYVLLLSGGIEEAHRVFGEALELSANDPPSQLGAALTELLTGAEGETRLEQAAARLPGNPVCRLALGAAYLSHDKRREARPQLFEALRWSPAVPEVYRLLAQAFAGPEQEESRAAALRAYRRLFR